MEHASRHSCTPWGQEARHAASCQAPRAASALRHIPARHMVPWRNDVRTCSAKCTRSDAYCTPFALARETALEEAGAHLCGIVAISDVIVQTLQVAADDAERAAVLVQQEQQALAQQQVLRGPQVANHQADLQAMESAGCRKLAGKRARPPDSEVRRCFSGVHSALALLSVHTVLAL